MLDRPIAAFDIETVPDPDYGRRVLGLAGDDAAVIAELTRRRLEETEGKTEYPVPPLHRVVTVACAWLDATVEPPRFKLATLGGEAWDETSHLEGFARLFAGPVPPRLVSWNGGGFDLPVLRYRSMLHGIAIPALYRDTGDWKWDNYQNRFHTMHLDLMDVLTGYGASPRVGLGLLAEVLGLPAKRFLEGEVYQHVLAGEHQRVREYCKLDVLTTLLVFLRFCLHRGDLDRPRAERLLAVLRAAVAAEAWEGWREVEAGLAGALG